MSDPSKTSQCPICEKATDAAYKPFCSKRCADVDLHRWFSGSYSVPVVETDDIDLDALEEESDGTRH